MSFIPYGKQSISSEDIKAVSDTLRSELLTTGPKIQEFEKAICEYTGAQYAVSTSNATASLHLLSICLLKKNDKVLTTANSFVATSNSILYANAIPIFIDIDSHGNIDLDLCEEALKKDPEIKAIYGVHFSGNPLDQNKLKHIKDFYKITIIEDSCHSIGSSFNDVKTGSCTNSTASVFSFHPVKHITTGEGGMITTNDITLYQKLIKARSHGIEKKTQFINKKLAYDINGQLNPWYHEMTELGFNYRLTDIQAALGLSQLKKLDTFVKKRHELAKNYDSYFAKTKNITPLYPFTFNSSYHLYVVKVNFNNLTITKADLFTLMKVKNIGLQVHYIPINWQPYYQALGYGNEALPQNYKYYEECISLPLYPFLTNKEQEHVIQTLQEIIDSHLK